MKFMTVNYKIINISLFILIMFDRSVSPSLGQTGRDSCLFYIQINKFMSAPDPYKPGYVSKRLVLECNPNLEPDPTKTSFIILVYLWRLSKMTNRSKISPQLDQAGRN